MFTAYNHIIHFICSPPLLLILGGIISIFLRRRLRIGCYPLRGLWAVLVSLAALISIFWLPRDNPEIFRFAHLYLHPLRLDNYGLLFSAMFCFISVCGHIYALKFKSASFVPNALFYAGAACGVVLAGDLINLYFFWEIMAVSATFLILSSKSTLSFASAMRYVSVHIAGGLFLLAGIVLYYLEIGDITFSYIGLAPGTYSDYLIFIGFCINAGVFPLHAWISDSYPESSVYGSVFLAALTTKSAVCVLARSFAGADILIWLGLAGAVWATIYAILGGNLRRVLSYCLVAQVGLMLCGIGFGSELAVNGAVAHAVGSDLYQTLLFMCAGCCVVATGSDELNRMGGLRRYMPVVCVCTFVAAASACGLPLFVGFVTKSITVYAAQKNIIATREFFDVIVWFLMVVIVLGVTFYVGVKSFWLPFFGKIRIPAAKIKKPCKPMQLACVLMAIPCVLLGLFPNLLYQLLPYQQNFSFHPFSAAHVIESLLYIVVGVMAAFAVYKTFGRLTFEKRTIADTDLLYRKGATYFYMASNIIFNGLNARCARIFMQILPHKLRKFASNFIFYILMFIVNILVRIRLVSQYQGRQISIVAGRTLETATLPIGLTGFVIVVFIVIQLFFILVDF